MSLPMPPASSRDAAEIEKFAALAATWWDPSGPFAALHRMNPVRLSFIRERASAHFGAPAGQSRPLAGLKALDLGCGGGLVTLPLARMGAAAEGLDAGEEAIAAARHQAKAAGLAIQFRVGVAEDWATRAGASYDLITALEIVEHVADLAAFLQAAAALLKPGGLLIVSTINRTPRARALALFAAEKVLRMAPEGAHDFEKLVTPDELSAAAPMLDWETPRGLTFDPIGRRWALSDDVSMNYLRAATKPRAA